jgi:succinylglutamate desuccinylase
MGLSRAAGSSSPAVDESLYFDCFDHFPVALLDVPASELWLHLRGPSFFHIPGRQREPVFVSVLLHGNEDTGWRAIQSVLRHTLSTVLHRPILLFVGNIGAAKANVRTLPQQEDFNRAWPGTSRPDTPTARLLHEVVEMARRNRPFASIDIHNNTGYNPHYACVNSFEATHLHLARLFSRTVVYFEQPLGVQSAALAKICPAVTVECGRVGEAANVDHAVELINSVLAMRCFPDQSVRGGDLDLMRTVAIVKVPAEATFSYNGRDADFRFRPDLDRLNFAELDAGALFGRLGGDRLQHLEVTLVNDALATDAFFGYASGEIRLLQRAIPAMLTLDPHAVRLDCLGYLMRRIGSDGRHMLEREAG